MSKRVILGEAKVGIGLQRRVHKGKCQGLDTIDGGTPKKSDIKRVIPKNQKVKS